MIGLFPRCGLVSHPSYPCLGCARPGLPLCLLPASLRASQSLGLYPHGMFLLLLYVAGWYLFPKLSPGFSSRDGVVRVGSQPDLVGLWGCREHAALTCMIHRLASALSSVPGVFLLSVSPASIRAGPGRCFSLSQAPHTWRAPL